MNEAQAYNEVSEIDEEESVLRIRKDSRVFVLLCMLGFFCGIFYGNLWAKDYIISMGIFNEYFLKQYQVSDLDNAKSLWYVIKTRSMPVLVLGAFGITRFRKAIVVGFLLWTGFSFGLLFTAAVMKMGVKGMVFFLLALVPHFPFYIAAYLLVLWYIYFYPQVQWNRGKTVAFLLFLMVGIFLEGYVNPVIMHLFLGAL